MNLIQIFVLKMWWGNIFLYFLFTNHTASLKLNVHFLKTVSLQEYWWNKWLVVFLCCIGYVHTYDVALTQKHELGLRESGVPYEFGNESKRHTSSRLLLSQFEKSVFEFIPGV